MSENADDTRLTESDRFVANWLVEKLSALTDEQRRRITGEVGPIQREPGMEG